MTKDIAEQYPEHTKQRAILQESQTLGEFLEEWLPSKGYLLAEYGKGDPTVSNSVYEKGHPERLYPVQRNIQGLLAEFFGIDLDKIEAENRAMIEALRNAS